MNAPVWRRLSALTAALGLASLLAVGCAPKSSDGGSGKDEKTGTVRVWLFKELNNKPKQKVIARAVDRFEKKHDDVKVDVRYIAAETRAAKLKGALNDPESAPDVIEYGNTDTAGYVKDGALEDVSWEVERWTSIVDTDATAKESVTVDDKLYGAPFYVGVRALYYRTDVFKELGLKPPKTLAEVRETAKKVRSAKPDMYGMAVGGANTFVAMPYVWANGGDMARVGAKTYDSTINSEAARKGIEEYSSLFKDDNCPARKCAKWDGTEATDAFANGKAGMVVGGDFSRQVMDDGKVKGKYGVVPLPGKKKGSIAPAFAGGNNIGVMKSSSHRTLSVGLMKEFAGKRTQGEMHKAMGFLPTFSDVRDKATRGKPFFEPFAKTLDAKTRFVPVSPGWNEIDASLVLPTMFQEVITNKKKVGAAAGDAEKKMNKIFSKNQ
ncbi:MULTISPECIES: extracellular solute-binding protein [unclassified Streptomyces]|uniref:extracellular solute-binding protein n=1 Tax=unclassified Streptomyces TaxID=2593676 RepID=UPI002DD8851A|nr:MULTISPECIES: extracellular solute-binding protein [unclassified Streptomyces]WSA90968.1 extracellular solute-binding protein [Streptomyces sp. NBC_01795]WSB75293.1 extracellular solute-binding protein [Streptomyces sp. NBC_01775]WSS45242.1 extracellular solute-binding protein [Streptomyces sp. NBC_01187]